ncbi:hypothetical protein DH2020_000651 [Rehmannia glutinosa]|uniref:YTH domain-containing family protein n=1 Tax=Rehmannia glutinosa TaxID=99300 RepID=A0ABR0XX68_REHGL
MSALFTSLVKTTILMTTEFECFMQPPVDSSNMANGIQSDRYVTPLLPGFMDPTVCYLPNYPYFCFEGNEWEYYTRHMNPDGVEMTPGAYGDNGSLVYHHGYGYSTYGPYSPATSPIPTLEHDSQLYGAQHYQYHAPYFQSLMPSGLYPTPAALAKGDTTTSVATDQAPLLVDSANPKSTGIVNNGGGAKGKNGTSPARPTFHNSYFNANGAYGRGALPGGIPGYGYQYPRFGFDGLQSQVPWVESPYFSEGQPRPITNSLMTFSIANGSSVPSSRSQNFQPHLMVCLRVTFLFVPFAIFSKKYFWFHLILVPMSGMNTASYMDSMEMLIDLVWAMYPSKLYGQCGNAYRSSLGYGYSGYHTRINGRGWMNVDNKYRTRGRGNGFYNYGNDGMDGLNELNRGPRAKISKNPKGFTPVALVVKGKNIPLTITADSEKEKLSVTPDREQYNRPDFPETYADAKFFIIKSYSEDDVNTSGQFVGVAEMIGPVDFNKNVEYWRRTSGLVKFEQGLEVLKIFKDHTSRQCILDDFDFYEDRQKKIQEKKARQQQKQAQVWEGKPIDEKIKESKESTIGDLKPEKSTELEVASTVPSNGDSKIAENSCPPKTGKLVTVLEKKLLANGASNLLASSRGAGWSMDIIDKHGCLISLSSIGLPSAVLAAWTSLTPKCKHGKSYAASRHICLCLAVFHVLNSFGSLGF